MTRRKQTIFTICALVILLGIFSAMYHKQHAASQTTAEPISATAFKLNTVVKLTIYDSRDESLLTKALALCDKYEDIFSRTKASSELYKLNNGQLPGIEKGIGISPDMAELIAKGLEYGRLSNGAFDIAIEPVSSLWDFTSAEKTVPTKAQITAALPLVNYEDVLLNDNNLQFAKEGMGLDLGAIAKGYIADKIKEFLMEKGVKSAIINLGGNVLCIGEKPDKTPFNIGIQKPFADRKETIAVMELSDKSIVSSGIYERFFQKDGTFYHHILNPKTGYPYDNSLVAVTIISDKSVDGDGLSTSCFALGLEDGMKLINSTEGVHAVFITNDYKLHFSDGFEDEIPLTFTEE